MVWLLFVEISWWTSVNLHSMNDIPQPSPYISIVIVSLLYIYIYFQSPFFLTNRSRISCDFRRQGEEHDYSEVGGRTFLIYKDHAVSTARFLVSGRAGLAKGLLSLMDLYRIISYHVMSCHIISYHYHLISYHIHPIIILFCRWGMGNQ